MSSPSVPTSHVLLPQRPADWLKWILTPAIVAIVVWSALGLDARWSRLPDAPGDFYVIPACQRKFPKSRADTISKQAAPPTSPRVEHAEVGRDVGVDRGPGHDHGAEGGHPGGDYIRGRGAGSDH